MYPEHVKKESCPHLFGYVQSVSLYPTIVTMWTEADLRLYFDMAHNGAVFFDATGKFAHKVFNDTGPILYYSLVVSRPTPGKAPIAVAGMFSSSHRVPTLTNFLMNCCRDQSWHFIVDDLPIQLTWKSTWVGPVCIVACEVFLMKTLISILIEWSSKRNNTSMHKPFNAYRFQKANSYVSSVAYYFASQKLSYHGHISVPYCHIHV